MGRSWKCWMMLEYIKVWTLMLFFLSQSILFFFSFIFMIWRLITLQYCSGFCHTLTWISHGFTCVPHPEPPSHLPPLPTNLDVKLGTSYLNSVSLCVLATQSRPTLCDAIDCGPPGSSVRGILQARILEWVSHSLLQGTFPTQGWNPGLLHCRQILFASLKNGDNGINLIGLLWWLNDKHRSRAQHSAQYTEWMPSHLSNSNNYHNYHHYCYYHHQGL